MKKVIAILLCAIIISQLALTVVTAASEIEANSDYGIYGAEKEYAYVPGQEYIRVMNDGELDDIVNGLRTTPNLQDANIAVAICYPLTGETAYYNADEWFRSGSIFKLPLCMQVENLYLNGDPIGLKIDNDYGVERAVAECLVNSNVRISDDLAENYITWDVFRSTELEYAGYSIEDIPTENRSATQYTARIFLGILQELYENQEKYPHVIDYMTIAQPGEYLKQIAEEEKYTIAQKYGVEPENYINNIGGIIFTPNPIIVVCLSSYITRNGASEFMGHLSEKLIDYAENTLDSRYEEQYRILSDLEKEDTADKESDTGATDNQENKLPEAATPQVTSGYTMNSNIFILIIGVLIFVLIVAMGTLIYIVRSKDEEDDDE